MKLLQVTSIEYDFQLDDETVKVSENFQKVITSQTIGKVYEVDCFYNDTKVPKFMRFLCKLSDAT
jgi:hypothetical protein